MFGRDWTTEGALPQMAFMIRTLAALLSVLLLGIGNAFAGPIDNSDGFWSDWSEATFERAHAEKKFVVVSLQAGGARGATP